VLFSQYGAKEIVPYVLTQRLLSVVIMVISVGLAPLWPAYGEAWCKYRLHGGAIDRA